MESQYAAAMGATGVFSADEIEEALVGDMAWLETVPIMQQKRALKLLIDVVQSTGKPLALADAVDALEKYALRVSKDDDPAVVTAQTVVGFDDHALRKHLQAPANLNIKDLRALAVKNRLKLDVFTMPELRDCRARLVKSGDAPIRAVKKQELVDAVTRLGIAKKPAKKTPAKKDAGGDVEQPAPKRARAS